MDNKNSVHSEAARIEGYRLPVYKKGAQHYVEFYVFNPATGKLARRKKMFDHIKGVKNRNEAALKFAKEISTRLRSGWNPFVEEASDGEYALFETVCTKYDEYLGKMLNDGQMREETVVGYKSKLKILKEWLAQEQRVYFAYQFNSKVISQFLDYVFIERNNTVRTRNNYLNWLSTFGTYLTQRQYVSIDPTASIEPLRYKHPKNRSVIPAKKLAELSSYLMKKNKHYLLACYLIYYSFIRPKELSYLKIGDVSIKTSTIKVSGDFAKNHKDAVLTIPKKVLQLMIDLDIFSHPGNHYIFSDHFCPGPKRKSDKSYRDWWIQHVRPDLKFPADYKFYSLKDSGITTMLKNNTDILTVRDQARHHSIQVTDIYTPHDIIATNQAILNYDGDL